MAKDKKDPAEKKGPPAEKGGKEKGAKDKGAKGAPAADKGAAPTRPAQPAVPPRLAVRYKQEIVPALQKRFNRTNALSLPRLQKISVNMGVGKALQDKNRMQEAV